ncbi:MAG: tetraacyldisaccharide 4'-kinase [Spirosomataceae bacterium]
MLRKLSNGFKWILWPLSLLYGFITGLRNFIYNLRLKKVYRPTIYTINIGNLTVGGTGKTPHIEYLIRHLRSYYNLATLSRGYGRKTKGFLQADSQSTAANIGDEPLQLYRKFGKDTPIYVCEKRAEGLQRIEKGLQKPEIVLLDDAFQHRAVCPHLNLLLTDYGRLFYEDYLLPMGLLRESKQGAKRAQAVIVTKCPPRLSASEKTAIVKKIGAYTREHTPVFFSAFDYAAPIPYFDSLPALTPHSACQLVSGIAQPFTFEQAASDFFTVMNHSAKGDHHDFTKEEVKRLAETSDKLPVLTTEKDWVKIKPILEQLSLTNSRFYYWPIQVVFQDTGFEDFILNEAAKKYRV